MSLIIKGMKMPEYRDVFGDKRGCVYLLMLTVNKDGTASVQSNDVDGGFHQVEELPTPHGRLIDADKFLKDNAEFADRDFIHPSSEVTLRELIDEAPTIIEAEGVNE